LPAEIDARGEGVVNLDLIHALVSSFDPTWEPLLDLAATAVRTPAPADLTRGVHDSLVNHQGTLDRGIGLATRAITNPFEARPFVHETFAQLGADGFETALAVTGALVEREVALLASQQSGAAILGELRAALATAPTPLSQQQQERLTRANH